MTIAYIGLGANLGQPQRKINAALAAIETHKNIQLLDQSSPYKSDPLGPSEQPDYINAVAKLSTALSPHDLLNALLRLETKLGRTRDGTHWGPRIIDIDLLYYGQETINDVNLTIPHPEIANRNFVVYPLAEIEPDFILPDGRPLTSLLDNISPHGLEKITI